MEYRDYSRLQTHRQRVWKLSDGVSFASIGGLDVPALLAAGGAVFAVGFVVFLITSLIGFFPMLITAIAAGLVGVSVYLAMARESVKDTPAELLKKLLFRRWQPQRYTRAIGTDWAPTTMHWQIVLWRPEWAKVRIGPLRQWETYDPAPISEDTRRILDPTGAGAVAGWGDVLAPKDQSNPRLQINDIRNDRSAAT